MTSLEPPPIECGVEQVHQRIEIAVNCRIVRLLDVLSVDHADILRSPSCTGVQDIREA
jgi:hypothetical protein